MESQKFQACGEHVWWLKLLGYCLLNGREFHLLNITMDIVRECLPTHLVIFAANFVPIFQVIDTYESQSPFREGMLIIKYNSGHREGMYLVSFVWVFALSSSISSRVNLRMSMFWWIPTLICCISLQNVECGESTCQLQMNLVGSLRSGQLPIILEEFREYTCLLLIKKC